MNINKKTNYSKDKNLWHLSHEGLDLEDPANEPKYNENGFLEMSNCPENAPDSPEYVKINFENCIKNRKSYGGPEKSSVLNQIKIIKSFIKKYQI